jgi:hypothetical protein
MHTLKLVMVASLVLIVLTGCNFSAERNPGGGLDVTVAISEADVNTAVRQALDASADPLLRNPSVDLQNGRMVISGEHDRRDGGGRVSGSVTLSPGVTNGMLTLQASSLAIEGFEATDDRLVQFNERLAAGLNQLAASARGQITVQAVTVTDSELQVRFNAQR